MKPLMLVLGLAAWIGFAAPLATGCATQPASGSCEDYKPAPLCSPGFVVRCEVTRDGCEQCGCVRVVDESGRSPYEHGPR